MKGLLKYLGRFVTIQRDMTFYPLDSDFRPDLRVGNVLLNEMAVRALESGRYGVTIAIMTDSIGNVKLVGFGLVLKERIPGASE